MGHIRSMEARRMTLVSIVDRRDIGLLGVISRGNNPLIDHHIQIEIEIGIGVLGVTKEDIFKNIVNIISHLLGPVHIHIDIIDIEEKEKEIVGVEMDIVDVREEREKST